LIPLACGHAESSTGAPPAAPSEQASAAAVVTAQNLYRHEAFWPYHVRLTEAWKPESFEGERFGWGVGVLIRVEPSGLLRVDFARFGDHSVPPRVTDVVEEANRIRLGQASKAAPNFVQAVANRLLDPSTDPIEVVPYDASLEAAAFLIVAVDPGSEAFAGIASALEPVRARDGITLVLFAQGGYDDPTILEHCKQAGWSDPYLLARFTAPYTASYLGDDPELPSVLLNSPEGRVIFSSAWSESTPASLVQAIDREFGQMAVGETQRGSE
jgi:hypothetical protein